MAIKLNNFKEIATIIKMKYGENLYHMNFIFCFKKNDNSYFIFQEIQGMPIKRIVYHESNNSVTFVASWASWSNPYAMVVDANFEKIENWKDLQDRSRPYNSYINIEGGFDRGYWQYEIKQNKIEKKKKLKNKSDTFVEFRIDKIQRANFNKWGFELYSPTISMIGFTSRSSFPYDVRDIEPPILTTTLSYITDQQDAEDIVDENEEEISVLKITWQGGSFNVPGFQQNEEISQVSNIQGEPRGSYDLSSYWDINDGDEENERFDEEIADILLNNKEAYEDILDVGQRKVDLDFGD